jgi:hypothetical protein
MWTIPLMNKFDVTVMDEIYRLLIDRPVAQMKWRPFVSQEAGRGHDGEKNDVCDRR